MTTIKKAILDAVQRTFGALPKTILRSLLDRKVEEAGIKIPSEAINALTEHILSGRDDDFVWNDSREEGVKLALRFTEEDGRELDCALTKALEALPDASDKAFKAACDVLYRNLTDKWPVEHATQQLELQGFQEGLEDVWGLGLDYLRMMLTCCREIGAETLRRHEKSKSVQYAYRRWVLVRLHARACQVTDEIICLLENGFADGAMARWRTLHELSVVAALIADGDEGLAERYVLHDAVEVKRQADEFDETQVPLGSPPISKRNRKTIDRQYDAVLKRFGPPFAHPYGWAAKRLNHKKPTFKEIQIAAGRASMNSDYKMASFNVHAGARSLFFNLSSIGEGILLSGRSNAGLADPGIRTAQTLLLITSLYAGNRLDIDRLAQVDCLLRMRGDATNAFQRADRRLQRMEREARKDPVERRRQ